MDQQAFKVKESAVVRQLLDYLAAERKYALRLNTGTFFMESNGKQRMVRAHSAGPGAADIVVLPPGTVWIEAKRPGGRQSELQESFARHVEGFGHHYILARSIDDLNAKV